MSSKHIILVHSQVGAIACEHVKAEALPTSSFAKQKDIITDEAKKT